MKKLLLINPNINLATTAGMMTVAVEEAAGRIEIEAATVERGPMKVVDVAGLEAAADAVSDLLGGMDLSSYAGIIIGGFGDPGIEQVRRQTAIPVTGIAEAAAAEVAAAGVRFSVIMTTPGLVSAVEARFAAYGCRALLAGIRVLRQDATGTAQEPATIETVVHAECEAAIRDDEIQAVLIGGGPLASVARALRSKLAVPLIEPLPASVRLALARAQHEG